MKAVEWVSVTGMGVAPSHPIKHKGAPGAADTAALQEAQNDGSVDSSDQVSQQVQCSPGLGPQFTNMLYKETILCKRNMREHRG